MDGRRLARNPKPERGTRFLRATLGALVVLGAAACEVEEPEGTPQALPDAAIVTGGDAGAIPGQPGGLTGGLTGGTGGLTGGVIGGLTGGTTGGSIGGIGFDAGGGWPPIRDAGLRLDSGVSGSIDAGTPVTPVGDGGAGSYEEVRQICVDTINMYRATLNLPPLARANAMQEACSDEGAKYDGDLNRGQTQIVGHQSTSNRSAACRTVGFSSQNTCPNWGVGPRTGNATLADAIKRCLAQMWAEGEPPQGVSACIADRTGCFPKYGHWINMTSTTSKGVACGFYNVEGGTYWMNQDFTR